jgi:hypothetical protein
MKVLLGVILASAIALLGGCVAVPPAPAAYYGGPYYAPYYYPYYGYGYGVGIYGGGWYRRGWRGGGGWHGHH